MGGSLGSGQFGVVSRGKWQGTLGGQPLEVAIKTLRPAAKEREKLKFLQEAAINGQFKHPNIVKLHGVVTVGEPVGYESHGTFIYHDTLIFHTGHDCIGIFIKR